MSPTWWIEAPMRRVPSRLPGPTPGLLLAGLLLCLAAALPARAAQSVYSLAVVPQFTTVEIGQRWAPLLERLRKETGIDLRIRTTANIPAFEAEFLGGIPDFAYLNPYHMVMAAKAQGYKPLIRGGKHLSGILVVKKDGPIKRVSDLAGATLAFPAPNAFGASLYMRALLSEQEKLEYTPTYVGTHQNVYRHVIYGDAQAGGGVESSLAHEPEGVRHQVRILYRTPETPSHPLAVHPRVPGSMAARVTQALRNLARDEEGRALLRQVELDQAVAADYARDYAPLERLRLERYVVLKAK